MKVIFLSVLLFLVGRASVYAQGAAPETVENMVFQWTVEPSTPIFGGVRQFRVLAARSAIYNLVITPRSYEATSGRHRWTKKSADAGVLEFTDAEGRSLTQFELTFRAGSEDFGGSFLIPGNGQRGEFGLLPFSTANGVPLRNGSVRSVAGEGRPARLGFVTGGAGVRRVLVRAIGPTLERFGEAAPARELTLRVLKRGVVRATNGGWDLVLSEAREAVVEAFQIAGAFPLERGSGDCALLLNLEAGNFVAEAEARAAGTVLIEVYVIE
jgi:hypothetical protein